MISAKIRNKDRLLVKLKRMAPEAAKSVYAESKSAANQMVALAKSFAPVKTGWLRASIVATPGGTQSPAYSQPGGAQLVPEGSVLVTAGDAAARYAHLVEYGARPHEAGGMLEGASHPGAPAQPFFWPAYRLVRKGFRSRITRAMNKGIKQALGK